MASEQQSSRRSGTEKLKIEVERSDLHQGEGRKRRLHPIQNEAPVKHLIFFTRWPSTFHSVLVGFLHPIFEILIGWKRSWEAAGSPTASVRLRLRLLQRIQGAESRVRQIIGLPAHHKLLLTCCTDFPSMFFQFPPSLQLSLYPSLQPSFSPLLSRWRKMEKKIKTALVVICCLL